MTWGVTAVVFAVVLMYYVGLAIGYVWWLT